MKKLLGGIFARSQSAESARAAATPTTAGKEASLPTVKRWGGFLLPSTSVSPPSPVDQEMIKNVDTVLRGVAARVKAVITKMANGETHSGELQDLVEFTDQTVTKLQQSGAG
ncbi:hypothetical protein DVH05_017251 [Phytophthora capsici]|nr:hypothetical protein DVH05_017251 [Phytophthora capsici]